MARARRQQREHRPHELGPRVFFRGRWAGLDLRPWGGKRETARDPSHPNWPRSGAKTTDEAIAREWGWKYVAHLEDAARRASKGMPAAGRVLRYAIEEYLDARQHGAHKVTRNTVAGDKTALIHLEQFCTSEWRTDRILVKPDGQRAPGYKYLQDLADSLIRTGYAPSTVQLMLRFKLAPFFEWAGAKLDLDELSLPAVIKEEARAWSDDELGTIREAADWIDRTAHRRAEWGWPPVRKTVETFLGTGARQQEGFVLDAGHIKHYPDYSTIRIVGQNDLRGRSGIVPLKGKKDTKGRVAVLLHDFVEWYLQHYGRERGLILGCADGSVLGAMQQRRMLVTRRDRDKRAVSGPGLFTVAGLDDPGVGWHTFRHTYARLSIERGSRFEELRGSLGHKSVRTSEQEYGHFHEDVAAKLAGERMARLREQSISVRSGA